MNKGMLIVFGFFLLSVPGSNLWAQQPAVSLDDAIKTGAREIESNLAQGVKVAVLNFNSPSQRFSNYVLDEMMTVLVKSNKLTVVDRANLELIRSEMNFQMSGEVSDNSAQAIGKMLGAQSIISGLIEDLGDYYRIRFRTIGVESAAVQALSSINVRKDNRIANLMGEKVSKGRKIGSALGYGAMNIGFGLGSYLQGDVAGGLIVTGGYAASLGLIIWEVAGLTYDDAGAGIPGTVGLGLAGVTLAFGFIKPAIYSRNPRFASVMDKVNIAPVSGEQGSALRISYTYRF
jgi:TolB-like protein